MMAVPFECWATWRLRHCLRVDGLMDPGSRNGARSTVHLTKALVIPVLLVLVSVSRVVASDEPAAEATWPYAKDMAAFIAEIDRTYPFMDTKGIRADWDETKKRVLRNVQDCASDKEFAELFIELGRCLRDAHLAPRNMKIKFAGPPPRYYPGISFLPATDERVIVLAAKDGLDPDLKPRTLADWQWHTMAPAGWIMSLIAADVDGDGDQDVVATDRKGAHRACRWLENPGPGPAQSQPWTNHVVGGANREMMFMTVADLDGDEADDVLVAVRPSPVLFFRRQTAQPPAWQLQEIPLPEGIGTGKGVAVGDLDADDTPDVVFSCENAQGDKSGVMWLRCDASLPNGKKWTAHRISGPRGIKFDRIELLDLDGDADLDVMTCEESHVVDGRRHGLGVIWYENPGPPGGP